MGWCKERLATRPRTSFSIGTFVRRWGNFGKEPGQLFNPSSLAVDSKNNELFVTDACARVQVFSLEGKFLRQWGSQGDGDGQFRSPSGVALGEDGLVYVSDTALHVVQVFDRNGKFLRKFGMKGNGPGQLMAPLGVTVGKHGLVLVYEAGRLQSFRADGQLLFGCYSRQESVVQAPSGAIISARGEDLLPPAPPKSLGGHGRYSSSPKTTACSVLCAF